MTGPTATRSGWPNPFHRTMAEVLRDEAVGCFCEIIAEHGHRRDCKMVARIKEASW